MELDMRHGNKDVDTLLMEQLLKNGQAGWANMPGFPGSVLVQRNTGCLLRSPERKPITSQLKIKFPKKNRYDRNRFRFHVCKFEVIITHMYLDREGFVTVGLVHLIRNVDAVKNIIFLHRGKAIEATDAEKMKNYNLVLNSGMKGAEAKEFKDLTDIDLDLTENEALFDTDVAEFLYLLGHDQYFPDFETYPAGVQHGMLDIAYTMGVDKFFVRYGKMKKALESRNWLKVADESGREVKLDKHGNPGLMADRNRVVRGWFLEAIKDEPFFLNPQCQPKQLSVKRG